LRTALQEHFSTGTRVIAEPGRYFVSGAYLLAVNIIARRTTTQDNGEKEIMYYVNDGVYGSFNSIIFDHAIVQPKILTRNGKLLYGESAPAEQTYITSIWGPTCDSMDCITKTAQLPEMEIGDWLYFENMGAYTNAAASTL